MSKRILGAACALALGLTLAACGGSSTSSGGTTVAPSPATSAAVTESTVSAASSGSGSAASDEHNAVDVVFATMMIPHHQGAIEMSDLALAQASSPQVKDLAGRIKAAQGPEIELMQGWLDQWDAAMPMASADEDTGHGMGHGATPQTSGTADDVGLGAMMSMSESDMTALRAATGAAFDTLFLQQMIAHHQGAIDMAGVETARGENPQALALAAAIATGQASEITEMQKLLASQ